MLNWVYFILIAQGIWALCALIDKIVISKEHIKSPAVYIVLNGAMNVLLAFVAPFTGFEPLGFTDFLIALLSGALFSASVAVYYEAVRYDEISRISMLSQISPIFVLALSFLFLGETLARNHFIGFSLLIGAGVIVAYKRVEKKIRMSKAFYLMLLSAFLSSISLVMAKHIFSVTSFWSAFFWLRISGFTALCVLLAPSIRSRLIETFKGMKSRIKAVLGLKMVIDFSAFIFSGYALANAPASLASALSSSLQPIFVFAAALVASIYLPNIIKEDIGIKAVLSKLLAVALVIAGIVFVNL